MRRVFDAARVAVVFLMVAAMVGCGTTYHDYTRSCPEGHEWSYETRRCVDLQPVQCQPGYQWKYNQCVSVCRGGKAWHPGLNSCECPGGTMWSEWGERCVTPQRYAELEREEAEQERVAAEYHAREAKKCPEGTKYVPTPRNSLMGPCFSVCGSDERWDTQTKSCVPKCPAGQKVDFFSKQCVSLCQGGWWDQSQAVCICPAGQEWDDFHQKCVVPRRRF